MISFLVVLLLAGVAALLFFGFKLQRTLVKRPAPGEVPKGRKRLKPIAYILGGAGLFFLAAIISFIRVVPVGHALVIFWIIPKTYSVAREGINFIPPVITQTSLYDLRRVDYTMSSAAEEGRRKGTDDALWAPTSEGLQVGLDLTVWYRLNADKVFDIHRLIGPDFEEKVVRPAIRSNVRMTMSAYRVMDIYSKKRETIQIEIERRLEKQLEPDGIILEGVAIRNETFTQEFAKSVEEKQIAQQKAQKMEYVLQQETKEAERKEIEAGGKAKAIAIVSRELRANPYYIKYLYVDKIADDIKVIVSDQATIMDLKGLVP
jgi:regulator of protease activity HflC (stomatin/prohibitin superfamily)